MSVGSLHSRQTRSLDNRDVPSQLNLEAGLTAVLAAHVPSEHLRVVHREAAVYESTFPAEVVTCRFADGAERMFYIKYHHDDQRDSFGHKSGVAYEVMMYRDVLSRLALPVVKCYGSYVDPETGQTWLVLEFLEDSLRLEKSSLPPSEAAQWIGQFHRETAKWLARHEFVVTKRYDLDYYWSWTRRSSEHTRAAHDNYRWLPQLCRRFEEAAEDLTVAEPVIIHGEYTPHNILVARNTLYPVDWESAAIAVGEIDLAMVTDGWSEDLARDCEVAYVRSRWPDGEPGGFERRLGLARLYSQFRWLGDGWRSHDEVAWRVDAIRVDAERLGLL